MDYYWRKLGNAHCADQLESSESLLVGCANNKAVQVGNHRDESSAHNGSLSVYWRAGMEMGRLRRVGSKRLRIDLAINQHGDRIKHLSDYACEARETLRWTAAICIMVSLVRPANRTKSSLVPFGSISSVC